MQLRWLPGSKPLDPTIKSPVQTRAAKADCFLPRLVKDIVQAVKIRWQNKIQLSSQKKIITISS
ncbi:hypothetical protein D3C73_539390 [compost metagenome]